MFQTKKRKKKLKKRMKRTKLNTISGAIAAPTSSVLTPANKYQSVNNYGLEQKQTKPYATQGAYTKESILASQKEAASNIRSQNEADLARQSSENFMEKYGVDIARIRALGVLNARIKGVPYDDSELERSIKETLEWEFRKKLQSNQNRLNEVNREGTNGELHGVEMATEVPEQRIDEPPIAETAPSEVVIETTQDNAVEEKSTLRQAIRGAALAPLKYVGRKVFTEGYVNPYAAVGGSVLSGYKLGARTGQNIFLGLQAVNAGIAVGKVVGEAASGIAGVVGPVVSGAASILSDLRNAASDSSIYKNLANRTSSYISADPSIPPIVEPNPNVDVKIIPGAMTPAVEAETKVQRSHSELVKERLDKLYEQYHA